MGRYSEFTLMTVYSCKKLQYGGIYRHANDIESNTRHLLWT